MLLLLCLPSLLGQSDVSFRLEPPQTNHIIIELEDGKILIANTTYQNFRKWINEERGQPADAKWITSIHGKSLPEEQEVVVVTHWMSLVINSGTLLLPKPLALAGFKGSLNACGESIDESEPGSEWQCRAGG